MKSWIVAICMLILGIAIGFLIASKRPHPQQIGMAFSDVGDLFITPGYNDVIKWSHGSQQLGVKFKYNASPCVEGNPTDTCTVSAIKGLYFYDCKGCPDPGVGMGGDALENLAKSAGILPPPYANPKGVKLYCDSGTAKASDPITAQPGQSFQFYPVGGINFTVAFSANTCSPRDSLNNAASSCTVKQGAQSQPKYLIQIEGCGNGAGSLTVNP